jgi:hypothetical protein
MLIQISKFWNAVQVAREQCSVKRRSAPLFLARSTHDVTHTRMQQIIVHLNEIMTISDIRESCPNVGRFFMVSSQPSILTRRDAWGQLALNAACSVINTQEKPYWNGIDTFYKTLQFYAHSLRIRVYCHTTDNAIWRQTLFFILFR